MNEQDFSYLRSMLEDNNLKLLRDELSDMADTWVKIPMAGQVESLNAAIAASILMFETARQRRA